LEKKRKSIESERKSMRKGRRGRKGEGKLWKSEMKSMSRNMRE
jgi:hypothetical protein